MKKLWVFFLCCICSVMLLTGCQETAKTITGSVVITAPDGIELLNTEVSVNEKDATALAAITKACQDHNVPYTLKNGMLDNFGNVASTATDGWLLYDKGVLTQEGAKSISLEDGFQIELKYLNYDQYFKL